MKCKKCGMIMSPEEVDKILTDLINELNPDIMCNDCINEEEMIAHDYNDSLLNR